MELKFKHSRHRNLFTAIFASCVVALLQLLRNTYSMLNYHRIYFSTLFSTNQGQKKHIF